MVQQLIIKAKTREEKKPNALRREGFVPATLYGHGFASKSIQVNAKDFSKIPHKFYSHISQLDIDELEKHDVLIRNVQIDPVKDRFLNIEFYKIKSDEKIKVKVPINYIGHSAAVLAGGVLIISINELDVQCLPKDIPDVIDVNLEQIVEIGQAIQVKDLRISENVHVLARPNEVLAKVEIAKTHEIEEKGPAVVPGAVPTEEAAVAPLEGVTPASKEATTTAKQTGAPAAKAPEAKPAKGKEK